MRKPTISRHTRSSGTAPETFSIRFPGVLRFCYHTVERSNSYTITLGLPLYAAPSPSYGLENVAYSATTTACTERTIRNTYTASVYYSCNYPVLAEKINIQV